MALHKTLQVHGWHTLAILTFYHAGYYKYRVVTEFRHGCRAGYKGDNGSGTFAVVEAKLFFTREGIQDALTELLDLYQHDPTALTYARWERDGNNNIVKMAWDIKSELPAGFCLPTYEPTF